MKNREQIDELAVDLYGKDETFDCNGNDNSEPNRIGFIKGYTQCQEDMISDLLSLIEEYKEEELPNRNIPYHYEAEIDSGLNRLIEFIKNKQLSK